MKKAISTPEELTPDQRAFIQSRLTWETGIILQLFIEEFGLRLERSVLMTWDEAPSVVETVGHEETVSQNNKKPHKKRPYTPPHRRRPALLCCHS